MNIQELKKKILELNIPNNYYLINENLIANRYILNSVYNYWEFFYFDERGGKNDYQRFDNENAACNYLLNALMNEMKY